MKNWQRQSPKKSGKDTGVDTTTKLRQVIEQTLSFLPEEIRRKRYHQGETCQRTFQALRIDVNHEFEVLYEFMEKLPGTLKPGKSSNSDIPFRRRQTGEESFKKQDIAREFIPNMPKM